MSAPERQPCRGTCGGVYAEPDGFTAKCDERGCHESWACWDESCVRGWVAEHNEPDYDFDSPWHHATVTRNSAATSVGGA